MNLVCIGGPLNGRVMAVDSNMLDVGRATFAERPKLLAANVDLSQPMQQVGIKTYTYKIDILRLANSSDGYDNLRFLRYSPELNIYDAMMRLLQHYANGKHDNDAHQP